MKNIIEEYKENLKKHIIQFLDKEIDTTKKQLKGCFESCDKNYFSGSLDELGIVKSYIEELFKY